MSSKFKSASAVLSGNPAVTLNLDLDVCASEVVVHVRVLVVYYGGYVFLVMSLPVAPLYPTDTAAESNLILDPERLVQKIVDSPFP